MTKKLKELIKNSRMEGFILVEKSRLEPWPERLHVDTSRRLPVVRRNQQVYVVRQKSA